MTAQIRAPHRRRSVVTVTVVASTGRESEASTVSNVALSYAVEVQP